MEIIRTPYHGGLRRYRRRRRYRRLKNVFTNKENVKVSRSKFWKFRVIPKFRPKFVSSIKVLKRLRDAYVEMMLSFAGHFAQLNNGNVFLVKSIPRAPHCGSA